MHLWFYLFRVSVFFIGYNRWLLYHYCLFLIWFEWFPFCSFVLNGFFFFFWPGTSEDKEICFEWFKFLRHLTYICASVFLFRQDFSFLFFFLGQISSRYIIYQKIVRKFHALSIQSSLTCLCSVLYFNAMGLMDYHPPLLIMGPLWGHRIYQSSNKL